MGWASVLPKVAYQSLLPKVCKDLKADVS
jgi:hypothetical protein